MIPCELLGNNARYLDALADTTPPGLLGTPFGVVCDALRVVAASVWDVDPSVYRAGIAWAWYLGARPAALAVDGLRALLCAALVSECAPLVRESQTIGELVALLSLWMDYRPTFADMEALFATYGVRVDVRAISDPEGQLLMPVDDTRLAFYIFVLSMDWARPMLLGDIAETARRASPLGARPFVLFYLEGFVSVPVAPAPTDGFLWVDVWESAVEPIDNTVYMFGFWYDTSANDWTFETRGGSDYQWMGITSQEDVTKLSDIGIGVSTTNATYGPFGCPTDALVNGNYKFVVLGYYDDLAGTMPSLYSNVNNFYMRSTRRDWVYITEIFLTSSISVNVAFYKVRIEAITPEIGYFNTSETAEALPSNTAIPLYRDGVQIPYESGRQYRARGLCDGDGNIITDNPVYFSFSEQNGGLYFLQSYTSGVTAKYIAFV